MPDDQPRTTSRTPQPPGQERLLEAILDATNLATYLKDVDGRYLFVNRQYERLANVPRQLVLGKRDTDFFPEPVARLFREQDLEVMARKELIEFEETIPLPGGVFSFITAKFPLIDAEGKVYAVGGVCTDITSRKKHSEETLAAARERLAVTLRAISEGVIGTDTEGNVVFLNPVAEALTGWREAEALGRPVEEIFRVQAGAGGRPLQPAREALARGEAIHWVEDAILEARDGARRCATASAAPLHDRAGRLIGAVLSFRDVTEQRQTAEELFKSRKLESVGLLAGGIAHDFNNLLEGILGNLTLAAKHPPGSELAQRFFVAAEKATLRARGLTRQLLTFSRGGDPVKEPSSIGEIIRDSATFALTGSSVLCQCEIPEGLWLVDIDRVQLSQVIQNLVINARQAMEQGGTVRIRCENLEGEPAAGLPDGRRVQIVVSDDGPGIPPKIRDRIFDPYFTTKEGGSGLGLAVAFSVIRKHCGHLSAGSASGGGASFTILLPAAEGTLAPAVARPTRSVPRGKRVMVMEDDDDIREVTGQMLELLGLKPVLAREGREAIALYREAKASGAAIDLVIMDLTIAGGMGGMAAVKEILALDPGARVIVSSGYSDDPCVANHREHGFVAAAVKPYSFEELREKIAAALAD